MTSLLLYLAHMLVLPLFFTGLLRSCRARLQNRVGPPLLQPLFDLLKLLRKSETVSASTTWVFRAAPVMQLAAIGTVALMLPWLGVPAPIEGDLFLAVYLLVLGKFAMGLGALDAGSPFGGLGASRESTISVQVEPSFVLALAALAGRADSSRFSAMLVPRGDDALVLLLVIVALWLAALAEMSRMPIDDPTTHLELTMIHEALLLENSGRNLALVEYGVGLKTIMLLGLVAQIILLGTPLAPLARWASTLGLLAVAAVAIAICESSLVKLRWRRIPNFLSFGSAAALLACLIVALRGRP